jgi:hypothetical protein
MGFDKKPGISAETIPLRVVRKELSAAEPG